MKSPDSILHFGEFTLDPANRRLSRGGAPVELGGRYLDTLVMLASAPGELISKDRLHEEVWRGVPVTDEALSQAIMALRRALGDDAARPRFIETVPRHGYRFVAVVETGKSDPVLSPPGSDTIRLVTGGMIGAVAAGIAVGLVYGSLAAGSGPGNGFSLVTVLVCVSVLAALVSGLGIAGGIALALHRAQARWWHAVAGGALGGMVVGGFARLLGIDTLRLLMGHAPDRIAGAVEGIVIGAAVGLGYWIAAESTRNYRFGAVPLLGAAAGLAIVAGGGTLMAGSLAALVARFPGAGLSLEWSAKPAWLALSGAFEGTLFVGLVVAGLARAEKARDR